MSFNSHPSNLLEINKFGEDLLEDSLNNIKQKENMQNNNNDEDRPMGGCPVFMNKFKEINIKFEPKYPINFMLNTYDYIFDKLNYENNDKYLQSKKVRSYPLHLRNTLFIRDEKVRKVRKMDFEQSYIIGEEMKEKINKIYEKGEYESALNNYILIYSFFKYLDFSSKNRENYILNNLTNLRNDPIVDEDIIKKQITYKNEGYNDINFKSNMLFLLKRISYCYIKLRCFSDAIRALDEAFEYANDTLPDIYFRRAQARMYNKSSNLKELKLAMNDLNNALVKKITTNEDVIRKEYFKLQKMMKDKSDFELNIIKKLLHNFNYALTKIKKNKLKIKDSLVSNIEMININYQVLVEMRENYYFALKYFKKNNEKEKFEKGLKEYDDFLDDFFIFEYYYKLDILNLDKEIKKKLEKEELLSIEIIRANNIFLQLFEDFKFRKCDDIFMKLNLNPHIYEKSYNTILERERILNPENNYITEKNSDFANYFKMFLNDLKNIFNLNMTQIYFVSVIIFIISAVAIIAPLI